MPRKTQSAQPKRQSTALSRLVQQYYSHLTELARQYVMTELGTRPAFFILLQAVGRRHNWTLIAEHEKKLSSRRTIRPDGTFKDQVNLVRGYWEAKDTSDDLDAEIAKKLKVGYPTNNIIFEDSATAVLFQHGAETVRIDMTDAIALEKLLHTFFSYTEPEIEEFEQAVTEFGASVPDLAEGLKKKIEFAHASNPGFVRAFNTFFELCKASLNPNISAPAVDEMLVQHLLTERLIREIFENPEFVRRNVIAAEVEKVMAAMTSQSFDRNTYLKDLDRFYIAIERAARTMVDFSDKQHFLNTVYERFFQGYSVKLADTMGIVYTPQSIVDFMCASVAETLETEFGKQLWSDDVCVVDPCTGTGNFIVNLIRRMPRRNLSAAYTHRLFANEIMLLPYYIAALNIEHAFFEQLGSYEPFEGLCFVDTLDLAEHEQAHLDFMTVTNSVRVERQKKAPITVILGNPPYNAAQQDDNDNNKNRKYPTLDERIRNTYSRDSTATLKAQLYDPYVRFFRWATDRLGDRDGIVCFVSNNGFVSKRAFDGMRRHLHADFAKIFHIDLHGDVRENPKLSGTTHNVFGIQVGVGITVAVKRKGEAGNSIKYWRAPEDWRKEEKLGFLATKRTIGCVEWEELTPDRDHTWLQLPNADEYASFVPLGSKSAKALGEQADGALFGTYSGGVKSNRDAVVYDFDKQRLMSRMRTFAENYNSEVDRYLRGERGKDADSFVNYGLLEWDGTLKSHLLKGRHGEFNPEKIRRAMYRPFTAKFLYFDRLFNNSVYLQGRFFPNPAAERENRAIVVTNEPQIDFSALMVNRIPCLHLGGRQGQCLPFYTYAEDGTNRRENLTGWGLELFQEHYSDHSITKWDVFHYVYAILHLNAYQRRFGENLKRGLPRVPFAKEFWPLSAAGARLSELHISYEDVAPWPLEWVEEEGLPPSSRIERMVLSSDSRELRVNDSLRLRGLPVESSQYRIGNRTALEWIIDQYQVKTLDNKGSTADPNKLDSPDYIIDLVGKVARVSVETVKIISDLERYYP